jgi:hypothetical protein
MSGSPCIQCRVSPQTKARLRALAQERQITESALLQRMVETALLQGGGISEDEVATPVEPVPRGARLYVRLRPDDHLLLRERAVARGMAAATYASIVLRVHLRAAAPLPDRELIELKRSVGELGMIGRNLNQIARVANQGGRVNGPTAADLRTLLRALQGLRDHVKALMLANTISWETGRAEADR